MEAYALGRLKGPELDDFEAHLLICAECQDQVAEADEFVAGVKRAAATLQREDPIPIRSRPDTWRFPKFDWFSMPVWAGALAAAALAVAIWIPRDRAASIEPEVYLQTMRGQKAAMDFVPAGKPFMLKVDMTGLPVMPGYRMEIATASGDVVWQRDIARQGDMASVSVPRSLPADRYWVRLSAAGGTLLREYSLESR
jgi:hypothetical protein